jgi:nucleobase:cation symporter-1, NCS1 family
VVNFLLNPGMILIGALAVTAGLSFWAGVTAVVLGIVIAFGAYIVMATLGVDYGLPGQVSTRMSYGIRGAKWIPSFVLPRYTGSRSKPSPARWASLLS